MGWAAMHSQFFCRSYLLSSVLVKSEETLITWTSCKILHCSITFMALPWPRADKQNLPWEGNQETPLLIFQSPPLAPSRSTFQAWSRRGSFKIAVQLLLQGRFCCLPVKSGQQTLLLTETVCQTFSYREQLHLRACLSSAPYTRWLGKAECHGPAISAWHRDTDRPHSPQSSP